MKVNKKYTHFAVRKTDGKIVNGWETISDVESLKYYAKTDLEDMDLNPKDFKILTKQHIIKNGTDPFNWDNWAKTNDMAKTKYKEYVDRMLKFHKDEFEEFQKIHDEYALNEDALQNKFNKAGNKITPIIREWENRLCSQSDKAGYGGFTSKLAEKFQSEIKKKFP